MAVRNAPVQATIRSIETGIMVTPMTPAKTTEVGVNDTRTGAQSSIGTIT